MRLSVDSDFASGPKNKRLARVLGLHRHHTAGAISEVWAACYLARSCYLTVDDVDNAAEIDGFADAMVIAHLAERVPAGHETIVELEFKDEVVAVSLKAERDGLRIEGAAERIDFLLRQAEKSRRGVEAKRERARSRTNPPHVSGHPVGQPTGNPMGEPAGQPARVNPTTPDLALTLPLALALAPDQDQSSLASHARARTIPAAGYVTEYDPNRVGALGQLAEQWWKLFSDASIAIAAELGLPTPLPFPAITPSARAAGFRELMQRIREEGAIAPQVLQRVLEVLTAQARDTKSIEWLSEKAFTEGGWRTARAAIPGWRKPVVLRGTQRDSVLDAAADFVAKARAQEAEQAP